VRELAIVFGGGGNAREQERHREMSSPAASTKTNDPRIAKGQQADADGHPAESHATHPTPGRRRREPSHRGQMETPPTNASEPGLAPLRQNEIAVRRGRAESTKDRCERAPPGQRQERIGAREQQRQRTQREQRRASDAVRGSSAENQAKKRRQSDKVTDWSARRMRRALRETSQQEQAVSQRVDTRSA